MIILDGGTGTLVQALGAPMDSDTWCADANLTHPDIVRQAHRAYLDAGAEVLIANTYATSPLLFNRIGRDGDVAVIDAAAVELARQASDGAVPVAGSFSVMRPGIPNRTRCSTVARAEARQLFAAKADGFVKAGADVVAMGMMRDGTIRCGRPSCRRTGYPCRSGWRRADDAGRLISFGRPNWLLEEFDIATGVNSAMVSVMRSSPNGFGLALEVVRRHKQLTVRMQSATSDASWQFGIIPKPNTSGSWHLSSN